MAPDHGVITAQDETELRSKPRGFFADQFEVSNAQPDTCPALIVRLQNSSNYAAHFDGTGPEIWRQTSGRVDAFVS